MKDKIEDTDFMIDSEMFKSIFNNFFEKLNQCKKHKNHEHKNLYLNHMIQLIKPISNAL